MKQATILTVSLAAIPFILTCCVKDNSKSLKCPVQFISEIKERSTRVSGDDGDDWDAGDPIGVYMYATDLATGEGQNGWHKQTTGGKFSPEEGHDLYYPADGTAVNFAAYHPYDATLHENGHVYRVDVADQSSQSAIDLMYAATSAPQSTGEVNLTFGHKLSRLIFNVTNEDTENTAPMTGLTAVISGMKIGADFDLKDPSAVTPKGGAADFTAKFIRSGTAATARMEAIVIPDDIAAYTVVFTLGGSNYTLTMDASVGYTYLSGRQYIYNVSLKPRAIQRETAELTGSSIDPWGVGNGEEGEDVDAEKNPPADTGNALFPGADFNGGALPDNVVREKATLTYGATAGMDGSGALVLTETCGKNDVAFKIDIPPAVAPTEMESISFYIKGTAQNRSLSVRTSLSSTSYYNLGDCSVDKTYTAAGSVTYGTGLNTGGNWVRITLSIPSMPEYLEFRWGIEGVYDIAIDNITFE